MGTIAGGYDFCYSFSIGKSSDFKPIRGLKCFLFEFRTDFILKARSEEEEEAVSDLTLDSETFLAPIYLEKEKKEKDICFQSTMRMLHYMTCYRLNEYWMTSMEINSLIKEALDFAIQMAFQCRHAYLDVVPFVVHLDVCTVQQGGESFDAAMDRAIKAQNLVPLYLWPQPPRVLDLPLNHMLCDFLMGLDRIRVEDTYEGMTVMPHCTICNRKPNIGAQISVLPSCRHAFHSHCIVRLLELTNLCPSCDALAYPHSIADCPSLLDPQGVAFHHHYLFPVLRSCSKPTSSDSKQDSNSRIRPLEEQTGTDLAPPSRRFKSENSSTP